MSTHDKPQPATVPDSGHKGSGFIAMPRLGYKRCTVCKARQAIKGGSVRAGRFVCQQCRGQ